MTDFDFDELDRAVSSALSTGVQSGKVTTAPTGETVLHLEGDAPESILPGQAAPQTPATAKEAPESIVPERPARLSSPASRRPTGRFMDMVHASSDMRPTSGPIKATTLKAPSAPAEKSQPDDTAAPLLSAFEDEMPETSPLESPFLPDAKVEKRPLGGPSPFATPVAPNEPLLEAPDEPRLESGLSFDPIDFFESTKKSEEKSPEDTTDTAATDISDKMPSLDAIDIDAAFEGLDEAAPASEPEEAINVPLEEMPEGEPIESTANTVVEPTTTTSAPAVAPTPVAEEPKSSAFVGPVSIAQQYQEKPVAPTESGAIYDTENYHKPIATPAKKKAGLVITAWIVGLVALGAALGAATYFFIMPML